VAVLWQAAARAAEPPPQTWERVETEAQETPWTAVSADPDTPGRIFAATAHELLESPDDGRTWQPRFRAPSQAAITDIAVSNDGLPTILVATEQGLDGSFDGGSRWSRVHRGVGADERHGVRVAFHLRQPGMALLGTRDGLFVSQDRGRRWKKVGMPFVARQVVDFAWDPSDADRVFLLAARGVFVGSLSQGAWRRRLSAGLAEESEVEKPEVEAASQTTEEPGLLHRLSAIALDAQPPPTLYLATSQGLQRSADEGATWQAITSTGLTARGLSRVLLQHRSPPVLYAATTEGVAAYESAADRWRILAAGLIATRINDLAATPRHLWAATDQGLYRLPMPPDGFAQSVPPSPQELLANFSHEPTIAQVREAAIRYAEVQPQKIAAWRTQARLRALLPTFSMDTGTNLTDFRHWDSGANPDTLLRGERDLDWSTGVSWDLGDLIWSADQTSIDVRSKLMVQLRDDIVDEVTRTYFERRRLQVALLIDPPAHQQKLVEQELRLQELMALLDGLTGGYFSRQISVHIPTQQEEARHGTDEP